MDADGDDLDTLTPGTIVSVIPYWTLGTVFPAGDAGTLLRPARTTATSGTKVQVTAPASESTGTPSKAVYYFLNGAWRQRGRAGTEIHDDDVLAPETFFTVKNPPGSATRLRLSGVVLMDRMCIPLATDGDAPVDNAAALLRPVPVTLDALGLLANHAFVKTRANSPGDRVILQSIGANGKFGAGILLFSKVLASRRGRSHRRRRWHARGPRHGNHHQQRAAADGDRPLVEPGCLLTDRRRVKNQSPSMKRRFFVLSAMCFLGGTLRAQQITPTADPYVQWATQKWGAALVGDPAKQSDCVGPGRRPGRGRLHQPARVRLRHRPDEL